MQHASVKELSKTSTPASVGELVDRLIEVKGEMVRHDRVMAVNICAYMRPSYIRTHAYLNMSCMHSQQTDLRSLLEEAATSATCRMYCYMLSGLASLTT